MRKHDYLLGTSDAETARLARSHECWRAEMEAAFDAAGFGPGQTILDLGAGPGLVTAELSALVGPTGKVVAYERSEDYCETIGGLGLRNVDVVRDDLTRFALPEDIADGAWVRWVLTFLPDPAGVVRKVAHALKPGGTAVFIDFFDYGAWEAIPANEDLARFRDLVIASCRERGGGPRVAFHLPDYCKAAGLELVRKRVDDSPVRRGDPHWRWLEQLLRTQPERLHELGMCSAEEAARFARLPDTLPEQAAMRPPAMGEIVVRKPHARP